MIMCIHYVDLHIRLRIWFLKYLMFTPLWSFRYFGDALSISLPLHWFAHWVSIYIQLRWSEHLVGWLALFAYNIYRHPYGRWLPLTCTEMRADFNPLFYQRQIVHNHFHPDSYTGERNESWLQGMRVCFLLPHPERYIQTSLEAKYLLRSLTPNQTLVIAKSASGYLQTRDEM